MPPFVVDASVVVTWFVEQPGYESAQRWLERFVNDSELLVGPDLLRFEVFGALGRLQPKRNTRWGVQSFRRFERLGLRTLPTTALLFDRAMHLARSVPMGSYDAIYLAHAEALGSRWLTADARILRRLQGDAHILALGEG